MPEATPAERFSRAVPMSETPAVNRMLAQVPLLSIQAAAFAKALEIARASPFALFCIATPT